MKNFIFAVFFACFVFSAPITAQQVSNTEFRTKTLQVFQNLDKTKVPHGILLDFGMEFTNLQAFNGTLADSTVVSSQTLTNIYKTLLMCRVRQVMDGFVTPVEYSTRWYTQRQKGLITLSGVYFKYSRFRDNAHPTSLNYSGNQFSDKYVSGVWQNPYEEKQLFAMAPSIGSYKGLSFNVKLPANLFFSNYAATIQSTQVDFGDELGYRTVAYNQLVAVNYAQEGNYTWKYKITLTNGQTLLSHSKIDIQNGIDAADIAPSGGARSETLSQYARISIPATVAYDGQFATATVYIRYAAGSTITKPLIVAEGFDTGIILKPEQEAGDTNIEDFLDDVDESASALLENEIDTYDVIYVDWDNGVDFIQRNAYALEEVIKWVNSNKVGNVQNVVLGQSMGGLIARYALRDIEVNRNFNHDTRLYVSHDSPHLGANTPLSTQYSLRHLRNVYVDTPLPLLGEYVIPLIYNWAEGFTTIVNNFGGNWTVDQYTTPMQAFSVADVPAARQMMYNWVNSSFDIVNTVHDSWQAEYAAMGYPQGYASLPIRNIAIANGSECGIIQPQFDNITSYIKDAGRDTVLSNYIGLLDAFIGVLITNPTIIVASLLPGKSYWEIDFQSRYMTILNENKNVYHGSIKYKKKILWFIPVSITVTEKDVPQPAGYLPYDIYGGGWHKVSEDAIPLSSVVSNRYGFIPTASALDIGKGTTPISDTDYRKRYIGAFPPSFPKNTPFHNYVTHFTPDNPNNSNSPHISFNKRNGDWLQSELNTGVADEVADCSGFCADTKITGLLNICTSSIYSVPSEATSATWSISEGSNLVTLVDNGLTATLTPINSFVRGYVTLNVTYSSEKCGEASAPPKLVWVGRPNVTSHTINNGHDNVSVGSTSMLNVNEVAGATQYYWYFTTVNTNCGVGPNGLFPLGTVLPKFMGGGALTNTQTTASRHATVKWGNCKGNYAVNCIAINICGQSPVATKFVEVYNTSGGGGDPCPPAPLDVYPNPLEGGMTINIIVPPPPCDDLGRGAVAAPIKNEVRIYDFYGNLLFTQTYQSDDMKVSVPNLKRGHYVLNVFTSKGETRREVIVVE